MKFATYILDALFKGHEVSGFEVVESVDHSFGSHRHRQFSGTTTLTFKTLGRTFSLSRVWIKDYPTPNVLDDIECSEIHQEGETK